MDVASGTLRAAPPAPTPFAPLPQPLPAGVAGVLRLACAYVMRVEQTRFQSFLVGSVGTIGQICLAQAEAISAVTQPPLGVSKPQ